MIKFFRHIRRHLIEQNKTGKYLKYALGEIALIITGVLIALSASNWNSNRVNSIKEVNSLKEIYKELEVDYDSLSILLKKTEEGIKSITYLDSLLNQNLSSYSNSMDTLFGAVYGFRFFSYSKANYEDLKVNNFNLIKSDSLRQQLILVYETLYSLNEKNYDTEVWVNDELRPYYLRNFRNLIFTKTATPINADSIFNDIYYRNLVNYRLTFLKRASIYQYYRLVDEFEKLLELLDRYLKLKD